MYCVVLCLVTNIPEEASGLLGCDALSLGEWFLALWMIVVSLVPIAKLSTRYWTEGTVTIRVTGTTVPVTRRYVPDDLTPRAYIYVNANSARETADMEGVDPFKSGQKL